MCLSAYTTVLAGFVESRRGTAVNRTY